MLDRPIEKLRESLSDQCCHLIYLFHHSNLHGLSYNFKSNIRLRRFAVGSDRINLHIRKQYCQIVNIIVFLYTTQ